jgi:hypothetical protein
MEACALSTQTWAHQEKAEDGQRGRVRLDSCCSSLSLGRHPPVSFTLSFRSPP